MLFSLGHGQRIVADDGGLESGVRGKAAAGTKRLMDVAPGTPTPGNGLEAGLASDVRTFGYYFPDAPGDTRANVTGGIAALAAAMIEPPEDASAATDSDIPPIFTYMGQFIDHDITANTDRNAPQPNPISVVTGATLTPLDRGQVVDNILNLRKGSLGLDSLYGEGPSTSPFSEKVRLALRDPADRAKMRVGPAGPVPGGPFVAIPLPADNLADLPRLGDILADSGSGLTIADIDALPAGDLKKSFKDGNVVQNWRAMIGDGRNDENLIVAQLHAAFLRFHNAVADALKPTIPDADARFAEAQKRTQWYYQWLVVNAYLPHVCDAAVLNAVKAAAAPLYAAFKARVAPDVAELPLPLEFSVAAFRFGHSMVRARYDHNRNFGRGQAVPQLSRATFRQIFSFTGNDRLGVAITGGPADQLPGNWPIEWDRFAIDPATEADHVARKIDTNLAFPLSEMLNEGNGVSPASDSAILKQLAERNMRRGYRLNIPTGQSVVAAINAFDGAGAAVSASATTKTDKSGGYYDKPGGGTGGGGTGGGGTPTGGIAVIPEGALTSGKTGAAIAAGGFATATPLWFYVLKEAELAGGNRLGKLGSRLVAETLVGLVVQDATSYWHQGAGNGSWKPADLPLGAAVIDSMPKMLKACGLLA
jgi:Animal haem peroxidase